VNFPKFKAFGFGLDVQLPKPKPREVELIPLGEGQDIQPIQNPNSSSPGETDFQRQIAELKEGFVRETGISMQLFDLPDSSPSSRQTSMIAMQSISDQVEARRQLWSPIIVRVFEDALRTLALWDSNIKEIVDGDDDWYTNVSWPPSLRKDDPSFVTMVLNQTMLGYQSIQTTMERLGINAKEEIDRINDEMNNPLTAAIHGKMLQMLAEFKIAGPPSSAPPKINVNLRGDLNPAEVGDISAEHQIVTPNSPFPDVLGPQGNEGLKANDSAINSGLIHASGQPTPSYKGANGQSVANPLTPATGNQQGEQMASQPGSGQPTANTPQGNIAQQQQRGGQ
jgi:hypothetical protein